MSEKLAAAPTLEARFAGAAYLYIVVAGIFVELFVRSSLMTKPSQGS